MMRVTSCSASQASLRKLFGGLGGITLAPNAATLSLRSDGEPDRPVRIILHVTCHVVSYTARHGRFAIGLLVDTEDTL